MYRSPSANKRCAARIYLLMVLIATMILKPSEGQCAMDPWYQDLGNHWASEFIYVLWSEGVTDGLIGYTDGAVYPQFLPDLKCSRAQFTVFMAKTFDLKPLKPNSPTYPDVTESYEFLSGKFAWEWIEAARSAGITSTPVGHNFYPDQGITRQDAVDLLVRSLGLYDYASSMAEEEVDLLLNRFKDGMSTSSHRRHSMACAIKFRIIEGYEDGTIRPKVALLRCHAATVLYRSCMIRVYAEPYSVSPDGDGLDDSVTFSLSYLKNRGISAWDMAIEDPSGNVIYTFNPHEIPGNPPDTLTWKCRDRNGFFVPPGIYYYQAWVKDRGNRTFFSVRKPIEIVYYSLSGYLFPTTILTGQTLTIVAMPEPSAIAVDALFADGKSRPLQWSETQGRWIFQLSVGNFLPLGTQVVVVTAQFGDRTRNMTLPFERLDDLWISPYVFPNPIEPGQILHLCCESSTNIDRVEAQFLDHTIELRKSSGIWQKAITVPPDTPEGCYPIVFTGHSGNRYVTAVCHLTIGIGPLGELVFTLTR